MDAQEGDGHVAKKILPLKQWTRLISPLPFCLLAPRAYSFSLLAFAFLRCWFYFMPLEIHFEEQFESFYDNLQNVKDESAKRLAKG